MTTTTTTMAPLVNDILNGSKIGSALDDTDSIIEYRIAALIYKTFTIVFLIVGTCTNLISAIVYSKKQMRKTSYSFYLFALAIVDLCVTVNGNTRLALMSYNLSSIFGDSYLSLPLLSDASRTSTRSIFKGFDIRETSIVACRIHRFFTYFFLQLSSVLLCLLSIDRFFGVVLALKAFRFNKTSIARKVMLTSIGLLILLNLHFLVRMGVESELNIAIDSGSEQPAVNQTITMLNQSSIDTVEEGSRPSIVSAGSAANGSSMLGCRRIRKLVECLPDERNTVYMQFWWIYFYVDSAIYCILPFIIMFTCNILTIVKMIKSRIKSRAVIVSRSSTNSLKHMNKQRARAKKESTDDNTNTNANTLDNNSNNNNNNNNTNQTATVSHNFITLRNRSSILANEKRISILLISISLSFLLLTIPILIMEHIDERYFRQPFWEILLALAYMLMYFNHVVNFFFYCAFGPKFRNEVKKLFPPFICKNNRVKPFKLSRYSTVILPTSVKRSSNNNNNNNNANVNVNNTKDSNYILPSSMSKLLALANGESAIVESTIGVGTNDATGAHSIVAFKKTKTLETIVQEIV